MNDLAQNNQFEAMLPPEPANSMNAANNGMPEDREQTIEAYQRAFEAIAVTCQRAAKGDLEARILHIDSYGEIGPVLSSINDLLDLTDAFIRESGASLAAAGERRFFRRFFAQGMLGSFGAGAKLIDGARQHMKQMRDDADRQKETVATEFETSTSGVITALSECVGDLRKTSEELATTASSMLEKVAILSQESDLAGQSVASVASASEELSAAISEVSERIGDVQTRSLQASTSAAAANEDMATLSDSTSQIQEVVDLIETIATQTRLLALNATIEAARAGEAGKGFSVVAAEVKELASQTALATDSISSTVKGIAGDVGEVASVIQVVSDENKKTEALTTDVASATEEQNAATSEISRSMQVAAESVQNVERTVEEVRDSAEYVGQASESVNGTVATLDSRCGDLTKVVGRFTDFLRKEI